MKLVPQNNIVLCKLKTPSKHMISSGVIYEASSVPTYEVVAAGPAAGNSMQLVPGDIVVASSKGSVTNVDGCNYYMFKAENITGKVASDAQ